MSKAQIQKVKDDLVFVEGLCCKLLAILPSFDIANEKVLPYGLKPHTRSISWLAEQIITQQTKFNAKNLGIKDAEFEFPDASLHDCEIKTEARSYFVNFKVHDVSVKDSPSDIAALKELRKQYLQNHCYDLICCVMGVRFNNRTIEFDSGYVKIFSPQYLPDNFRVNLANYKIQAKYGHVPEIRSRKAFLELLAKKLKEAEQKKKKKKPKGNKE